jgi:DnaK suppressor protein
MEQVALEHFKRVLENMLAELERPLRRRDQIAIENTPDALDEVQNAAEREFAIRQLESQSIRLRDVKAALGRIEDGTYGECTQCESDISIKRLKAVPWTPYCLNCQDIADQNHTETEPELFQLTDRGPKIMRAGQSAKTD